MRPNPLHDAAQFLTQPGWFTLAFWLLLLASVAFAALRGASIPPSARRAAWASGGCAC